MGILRSKRLFIVALKALKHRSGSRLWSLKVSSQLILMKTSGLNCDQFCFIDKFFKLEKIQNRGRWSDMVYQMLPEIIFEPIMLENMLSMRVLESFTIRVGSSMCRRIRFEARESKKSEQLGSSSKFKRFTLKSPSKIRCLFSEFTLERKGFKKSELKDSKYIYGCL